MTDYDNAVEFREAIVGVEKQLKRIADFLERQEGDEGFFTVDWQYCITNLITAMKKQ